MAKDFSLPNWGIFAVYSDFCEIFENVTQKHKNSTLLADPCKKSMAWKPILQYSVKKIIRISEIASQCDKGVFYQRKHCAKCRFASNIKENNYFVRAIHCQLLPWYHCKIFCIVPTFSLIIRRRKMQAVKVQEEHSKHLLSDVRWR